MITRNKLHTLYGADDYWFNTATIDRQAVSVLLLNSNVLHHGMELSIQFQYVVDSGLVWTRPAVRQVKSVAIC